MILQAHVTLLISSARQSLYEFCGISANGFYLCSLGANPEGFNSKVISGREKAR